MKSPLIIRRMIWIVFARGSFILENYYTINFGCLSLSSCLWVIVNLPTSVLNQHSIKTNPKKLYLTSFSAVQKKWRNMYLLFSWKIMKDCYGEDQRSTRDQLNWNGGITKYRSKHLKNGSVQSHLYSVISNEEYKIKMILPN